MGQVTLVSDPGDTLNSFASGGPTARIEHITNSNSISPRVFGQRTQPQASIMHVQQLTVVVLLIFAATLPRGTQAQIRWVVVMEKGIKDNDISCNQQTADNKQASTCRVVSGCWVHPWRFAACDA